MIINRYKSTHKGNQPIRVLQFNVLKHFEETHFDFINLLKESNKKHNLAFGIVYHKVEEPIVKKVYGHIQTPFIEDTGQVKRITIHETFLSYVWCISYSLFVLYDEAIAKTSQIRHNIKPAPLVDQNKIELAQEVFNYGKSLIRVFDKWDKKLLPNPELYSLDDSFYIERANGLYLTAINFILCHEYAHAEKDHFNKQKKVRNDYSKLIELEKEADDRAIELILKGVTSKTKTTKLLGTLIGLCCMLYFNHETKGTKHPDTDDRIDNLLSRIEHTPENDNLWGIASLAYKLWDMQFSKLMIFPQEVELFKHLYDDIRQQVIKNK